MAFVTVALSLALVAWLFVAARGGSGTDGRTDP